MFKLQYIVIKTTKYFYKSGCLSNNLLVVLRLASSRLFHINQSRDIPTRKCSCKIYLNVKKVQTITMIERLKEFH